MPLQFGEKRPPGQSSLQPGVRLVSLVAEGKKSKSERNETGFCGVGGFYLSVLHGGGGCKLAIDIVARVSASSVFPPNS